MIGAILLYGFLGLCLLGTVAGLLQQMKVGRATGGENAGLQFVMLLAVGFFAWVLVWAIRNP